MEYMSQEGYDKLVAELKELENVELPRVREAIAEARDKGDLSENFEYHAAKREQGRLLSQIRFKQRVLHEAAGHRCRRTAVEGGNHQSGQRESYDLYAGESA